MAPLCQTVPIRAPPGAELATMQDRQDSPLNNSSPESDATSNIGTVSATSVEMPVVLQTGSETRPQRRPGSKPNTLPSSNSAPFRFLVVDNPAKLKDKEQMKANRKHVMHDYLDKERKKVSSTDIRVTGTGSAAKKRRRPDARTLPEDGRASAPTSMLTPPKVSSSAHDSASSRYSSEREVSGASIESMPSSRQISRHKSSKSKPTLQRHIRFADDETPSVLGVSGGFNNARYMRTSPDQVPAPNTYLGTKLQPFGMWPQLEDPCLNVEELKWSCSRKFGSYGLSRTWVPKLLKARHAFLSTICISASHDDIMMRGLQAPHERAPHGSEERMKVRSEVLGMINESLQDPEMATADATVIAVLHVLNSEIMGCDDQVMMIHQKGLHNMVRQRGGLEKLGVDGQLSSILTITMYLISALRETEPHQDFIKYGLKKRTKPPNDYRQLPESPVYCRPAGYMTIKRSIDENSPTFLLLEDLRGLTHAFVRASAAEYITPLTPINTKVDWNTRTDSVTALRDKTFMLPSAEEIQYGFPSMSEKYMYEAIRLVALVYSHALANEIPFSKAGAHLSATYSRELSPPDSTSLPHHIQQADGTVSWHLVLKSALVRTNISDCWDHMAGVLFWVTLIAGACANPDSPANKPRRELSQEEEEGRKWLAAVTVRCSIILSFEYGGAMLETLKRIVGIEQALATSDRDRGAAQQHLDHEDVVYRRTMATPPAREVYGPPEVPFAQRTFADFAQDFMM